MLEYESPSRWTPVLVQQSIDPVLLNDRRIAISEQMQDAIALDKRLARAEERRLGNSAFYPGEWVRLEIRRTDEWAEKLVNAWLEIWEIQGRAPCHGLFRAVFDWELTPLFATRTSTFMGESSQLELATRQPGRFSAVSGHFVRQMGKLISKWNRKMDVADREAMYKAVRAFQGISNTQRVNNYPVPAPPLKTAIPALTIEQVCEISSTHTWKQLAGIFKDIQVKAPGQEFSASFMPNEENAMNREWILGGNPACRLEFENAASIAARKLGYLQREGATDYWLDRIQDWMRAEGLDKDKTVAFRANVSAGEGLEILKIAEMSARICLNLVVRGTPQSPIAAPSTGGNSQSAIVTKKKRSPRSKEPCYEGAAAIIRTTPDIAPRTFCMRMDGKAEQNTKSIRYKPPSGWNVRSFLDQYEKRANTVSAFMARVRKILRVESAK